MKVAKEGDLKGNLMSIALLACPKYKLDSFFRQELLSRKDFGFWA